METWPMTEARRQLPLLFERARSGEWQLVGRRGRPEAVVAGAADLDALLSSPYRFHPELVFGEDRVGVWLPELEVHAAGSTVDEAMADLTEVMVEYAEDWQDHLHSVPNHYKRAGYVRRVQLAGDAAGVLTLLQRDADASSADFDAGATASGPAAEEAAAS
jgi:prevent-host-death family protein